MSLSEISAEIADRIWRDSSILSQASGVNSALARLTRHALPLPAPPEKEDLKSRLAKLEELLFEYAADHGPEQTFRSFRQTFLSAIVEAEWLEEVTGIKIPPVLIRKSDVIDNTLWEIAESVFDPKILVKMGEVFPRIRSRIALRSHPRPMPIDLRVLVAKNLRGLLMACLGRETIFPKEVKKLFIQACGRSSLDTARDLHNLLPKKGNWYAETMSIAMSEACAKGNLEIAHWLTGRAARREAPQVPVCSAIEAAVAGHFSMVEWIVQLGIESEEVWPVILALIRLLAVHRPSKAEEMGVLKLLRRLITKKAYELDRQTCVNLLKFSLASGSEEIVRMIWGATGIAPEKSHSAQTSRYEELNETTGNSDSPSTEGFIGAASKGAKGMLRWLEKNIGVSLTQSQVDLMFQAACMNGEKEMAEWLAERIDLGRPGTEELLTLAFAHAAANAQLLILEWLSQFGLPNECVTFLALKFAAGDTGGVDLKSPNLDFLWSHHGLSDVYLWYNRARESNEVPQRGKIEGLKWLDDRANSRSRIELQMPYSLETACMKAVEMGNFEVAIFIMEHNIVALDALGIDFTYYFDSVDFNKLARFIEYLSIGRSKGPFGRAAVDRFAPDNLPACALILSGAPATADLAVVESFVTRFNITADNVSQALDRFVFRRSEGPADMEGKARTENFLAFLDQTCDLPPKAKNDAILWLYLRFGISDLGFQSLC